MNYTNEEYADMTCILGEVCGNNVRQSGCLLKGVPAAEHPVVLNTSYELVHLWLLAYFLSNEYVNK
jgi:hypothetical protein